MSDKPPVQCGNCGASIQFAPGQLAGDPDAVAKVQTLIAFHDEALILLQAAQDDVQVLDGREDGLGNRIAAFLERDAAALPPGLGG